MTPHNFPSFLFMGMLYSNQYQTLYITKIDGAKFHFETICQQERNLKPISLKIRGKLTFAYVCIFAARSHDQNTYM